MAAGAVDALEARALMSVAAVASVAVRDLVTVPGTATVLGTSSHAVWLLAGDSVLVITTRDATRLPNSVEIAADAADGPFAALQNGAGGELGFASIAVGDLLVNVARWWDPRPALPPISPARLAEALGGLPADVPAIDGSALWDATTTWSHGALLAAARKLVGKGPGLTPEGDDYLAGAVAAVRVFGEALSCSTAVEAVDSVAPHVIRMAEARTTTFSAALIRYSFRGQVAEPAGAFLRALSGRGNIEHSHARLERVGHSSGPALAAGIVLGARSIIQGTTDSDRSYT